MKRVVYPALALLIALLPGGAAPANAGSADTISWDKSRFMALDEIEAGMTGVGRSVFKGTEIEEFQVQILGVLATSTPGGEMILARLSGLDLERSGIIAGMSGSPIFIKGRLIGALAFGWPFSAEPIAGITPIDNMISMLSRPAGGERSAPGGRKMTRFSPELWEALWSARGAGALEVLTRGMDPATDALSPLQVPVLVTGVLDQTTAEAKKLLGRFGFQAVQGGTIRDSDPPAPPLIPGSAVGVDLVRGSATLSAIGTVTWAEGDHLLAFGHRVFNLGPTAYPMSAARIIAVMPSVNSSFKIGSTGEVLGSITRDYQTGVFGVLGPPPRMLPIDVVLRFGDQIQKLNFEVVEAETLTPALVGLMSFNSLESFGRATGATTLRVTTQIELNGGRKINTSMIHAGFSPPMAFAGEIARVLGLLVGNPFESVLIDRVSITVEIRDTVEAAFLEQISIPPRTFKPGDRIPIRADFRDYRGKNTSRSFVAEIPISAEPGEYRLSVCDGVQADLQDQERAPGRYQPKSLEQMFQILESSTPFDRMVIRLTASGVSPVVAGRELPSLPKSMKLAVGGQSASGRSKATRATVIFETKQEMGKVVLGCQSITLNVETDR